VNSMPLSAPYRSLNELQRAGQPLVSTLFAFSATPAGPRGYRKGGDERAQLVHSLSATGRRGTWALCSRRSAWRLPDRRFLTAVAPVITAAVAVVAALVVAAAASAVSTMVDYRK
jgi:hypothetical protein